MAENEMAVRPRPRLEPGLAKAFKPRTGHAPPNYFNMLKIQLARQLLDTTQMTVNQLCYKVGLADMFCFSHLFSKIMGTSPPACRKTGCGRSGNRQCGNVCRKMLQALTLIVH